MSNSGNEKCRWVPPSSNSALLLRMHDRCGWSIINRLRNELWICNISGNRQLHIDREKIATIAPQIGHMDTKEHYQAWAVWQLGLETALVEEEIKFHHRCWIMLLFIFQQDNNVSQIIWVHKQSASVTSPSIFTSLHTSGLQTVGSLRTQTTVSHALSVNSCLIRQTSKISLNPSAVSLPPQLIQ